MAKKRFTHWAKTLRSDPCHIEEISESEAKEIIHRYVSDAEFRERIDRADQDHPVKAGIWLVWGWRYRK